MANTKTLLEPDLYFHIYNHAVGKENLFNRKGNYIFFLQKLKVYLQHYLDFYAYCLMPNHFHFVIKIKNRERILEESGDSGIKELLGEEQNLIPNVVSRQFGHFFNCYAQAYNRENCRKGSLFNNRFKREPVTGNEYLRKLIVYIHNNPVMAGLTEVSEEWNFSSYSSFFSKSPTLIKREVVIELFDDLDNFIFCHSESKLDA